jgi:hypothetical protein
MLTEGNTQRFWYWVIHQNRLPPKKIKHNSIMMDFDLFVAEKLQELRESSGSKKGVLPRPGYNSRWARKGTIAFSLSFFGMLLQFSDHFLDQHEKLWNFRCRFEHKHVVVNVFFPPGVSSSNLSYLSYGKSQSETMDFPYLCLFNSG